MGVIQQTTEERSNILGTEKIWRLLVQFAIPAILMCLVSSLYNTVDKIFVGRYVGDLGIAATTVSNPATRFISAFAVFVGAGGNAVMALKMGEGRTKEAEGILNNSFVLLCITAVIILGAMALFTEQLLTVFGCSEQVMPYALPYMRILLCTAFFEAVTSGMGMFIRTDGSPKIMMACTMSGCIINLVLDPLFIGVFKWGIRGAAIATGLAQVISGVMVLGYFTVSKRSTIKLRLSQMRIRKEVTLETAKLGFSSFVQQFLGSIVQALLLSMLTYYGTKTGENSDAAIAAVGVTLSVGLLFVMPVMGMQQAVQPILGYNYGAKKYDRVLKALYMAIAAAIVISTVGWAVIMLWAEELSSIFGAEDEFLTRTAWTMRIYNLLVPVMAVSSLGSNFFQAIGKPVKALLVGMSRQMLCLLPCILILPLFFGMDGVIYALPVADGVCFVVASIMLLYETRIIKKMIKAQGEEDAPEQPN
jgi:putative MATE family efflux protein